MDNSEMRLARLDLGPSWIDLGYGEPVVVQKILHKYLNPAMKVVILPSGLDLIHSQYQPQKGANDLVAFLENKYGAQVVVTNGAKQGIAATMYALKKMGHKVCTMHKPYWTSTPNLIREQGLGVEFINEPNSTSSAFMCTSPNNPDGYELTPEQLAVVAADAKKDGIKFIHDAAYYTPIYMGRPSTEKIGDVQIYSFAKMWGLSGLRIGYVVCHDENFVQYVTEYVERSCSGVSTASQAMALAIETYFEQSPSAYNAFTNDCRDAIAASRAELAKLNPEVIELETPKSNSMFGWGKCGPKFNAETAKVNMILGDSFGKPGWVRFNIAVDSEIIRAAVERLNGQAL